MTLLGGYIVLFRMRGCYSLLPSIALVTISPIHRLVVQCEWMGLTAVFNFGWRDKVPNSSLFNMEGAICESFDDVQTGAHS